MVNFFQSVLDDANSVQQRLLGPDYAYWKQINTPAEIGMSSAGSLGQLGSNVNGLIAYVQTLVTGGGDASKTGGPIGNKFFLDTGATCTIKGSNRKANRFIYISNVPDGSIPFVSSGLGVNFSEFKGLVPGLMSNAAKINPFEILQSFMQGSDPECQSVTLETIDADNNKSQQTRYMAVSDIKNLSPCYFNDGKNPLTGQSCIETFVDGNNQVKERDISSFLPDDTLSHIYFASLGALAMYLIYRISIRKSD